MITSTGLRSAVVTRLSGGLGNQLFQYATGKAIAEKHRVQLQIDLSSGFSSDPYKRQPVLERYGIQEQHCPASTAEHHFTVKARFLRHPLLFRLITSSRGGPSSVYWEKTPFAFDRELLQMKPPVTLIGYWQNPRYFDSISKLIRASIKFPEASINEYTRSLFREVGNPKAIGVHIRDYARDDLVRFGKVRTNHATLPTAYYIEGLNILRSYLPSAKIFVFGENLDIDRFRWLLCQTNVVIVDSKRIGDEVAEHFLLASCKNLITANSTYSWWAAWSKFEPSKLVIAPRIWFEDRQPVFDLVPEMWIKI